MLLLLRLFELILVPPGRPRHHKAIAIPSLGTKRKQQPPAAGFTLYINNASDPPSNSTDFPS